jgi:hypothetical protein
MKKTIVTTCAVLGIVFTNYLFAAAVGYKVSPSAINLSAIDRVTIHTLITEDADDCNATVLLIDDGGNEFDLTDVGLDNDRRGHLVFQIKGLDALEDVEVGPVSFVPDLTCGGDTVEIDEMINAVIINAGEDD